MPKKIKMKMRKQLLLVRDEGGACLEERRMQR